jgi:hypothetical protein
MNADKNEIRQSEPLAYGTPTTERDDRHRRLGRLDRLLTWIIVFIVLFILLGAWMLKQS